MSLSMPLKVLKDNDVVITEMTPGAKCVFQVRCQQFIAAHWEADHSAVRSSRYNRNLQDPGSPCHPSPCGPNTDCMVNNGGNPICGCVPGFIPQGSPVDGCLPPAQFPASPVILHNRLVETITVINSQHNVTQDTYYQFNRHNLFEYGSITI